MIRSPFQLEGFKHTVLEQQGNVLLLDKIKTFTGSRHRHRAHTPDYHAGYEVVILRPPGKPYTAGGVTVTPVNHTMPKSHEWGKRGFSYPATGYSDAVRKFHTLSKRNP